MWPNGCPSVKTYGLAPVKSRFVNNLHPYCGSAKDKRQYLKDVITGIAKKTKNTCSKDRIYLSDEIRNKKAKQFLHLSLLKDKKKR